MARLRTLKHEFFKNEDLAEIAPLGRLLFAGLWTIADRDGRLEDRPKRIKAETLPYDECDADALLADLAERGFIQRYEVDGERYIQITNFAKHQNPHQREAHSIIPAPPLKEGAPDKHSASTGQAPEKPSLSRVGSEDLVIGDLELGSGDLGVGESAPQADAPPARPVPKPQSSRKQAKTDRPPDLELTDDLREYAAKRVSWFTPEQMWEAWLDWVEREGAQYVSWPAGYRTWVNKQVEYGPPRSLAVANGRASPDPPRTLTAYERRVQERGAAQ